MKITILSLFPQMFTGFKETSIISRAIKRGLVEVEVINFRDYSKDSHQKVDDYPYGGSQGMILTVQPIADALSVVCHENSYKVMLSPEGRVFNQSIAKELVNKEHLVLVCGHYEGFDERIKSRIDDTISLGDYILTGGEIGAMAISDAIIRLLPEVIAQDSYLFESFENQLLEEPQYTHPSDYQGEKVPDVLLSGNHEKIRQYRLKEALRRTYLLRKDLLAKKELTLEEQKFLQEIIAEETQK